MLNRVIFSSVCFFLFIGCQPAEQLSAARTESADNPAPLAENSRVVIFVIDGLSLEAARTAAASGANNLNKLFKEGVTVASAYSVSPAHRLLMPDDSKPWGNTSPPNVAIHTGCHIFDSRAMDDIFLAARAAGINSVFIGGAKTYAVFNTADVHDSNNYSDAEVVDRAIQQFNNTDPGLLRVHLQRIRDDWQGPAGSSDPDSPYIKAIINADRQLGRLIEALKAANTWQNTTLIVSADHGMGQTSRSSHPADQHQSWQIFMGFYGPGIKKGVVIPYAESPDIAILSAHVLGTDSLKGHVNTDGTIELPHATGTLLKNIFEGAPDTLEHPRVIERYLQANDYTPPKDYREYRREMIRLLSELPVKPLK